MDEWVRGRAVCYVPVDTHVLSEGTVGAGGGGHIIFPEGCIMARPQPGLRPRSHLCHPKRRNLSGRQEEEWNLSCVCGGKRSCVQNLCGGDIRFAMADDVPWGGGFGRGREGESGAVLGELIGSFLEKVARVTLNSFYCMAFALDGFPGQLDIMSIA